MTEEWKPTKVITKCCNELIFSPYSGRYVECSCGGAFIDQTEFYIRIGGQVEFIEKGNDNE